MQVQPQSTMGASEWITIVSSIIGALTVSLASWYALKGSVELNSHRIDELVKDVDKHNKFVQKLNNIDMRTRLTLQKLESLEDMISGRRVDRRKPPESDAEDDNNNES